MTELFHDLLRIWFHWVEAWGYTGVFLLMAAESSIIPVPSEIVMPPAAFWAAQGKMNFWGVVAAGTAGSWLGSALSYWGALWLGRPLVRRYGKWLRLSEEKMEVAEAWVSRYGMPGIFAARLLPVVRHLISMPAGLLRMNFARFSVVTLVGAGLWCTILSWFGQAAIGANPELLSSPEQMSAVIKAKLAWFVVFVAVFTVLYVAVSLRTRRRSAGS